MSLASDIKNSLSNQSDIEYYGERLSNTLSLGLDADLGGVSGLGYLVGARLPVHYWFVLENPDRTKKFQPLPFNPSQIVIQRQNPTSITRTIQSDYVIRETAPLYSHTITIRGSSGFREDLGSDRNGKLIYSNGVDRFVEFDEFLKKYNHLLSTHQNSKNSYYRFKTRKEMLAEKSQQYRLAFTSIYEDLKFYVEPVSFTYQKAVGNKFTYQYELVLQSYAFYVGDAIGLSAAEQLANLINRAFNFLIGHGALAELALNGITTSLNIISNTVLQNVKQVIATLNSALGAAAGVTGGISNIFYSIGESLKNVMILTTADFWESVYARLDIPFAGDNDLALKAFKDLASLDLGPRNDVKDANKDSQIVEEQRQAAQDSTNDASYQIDTVTSGLTLQQKEQAIIPSTYGDFLKIDSNIALLAANTQKIAGSSIAQDRTDSDLYFIHYLQGNEDLRSVANKFLGDPDQWNVLASFNSMKDYRTLHDGSTIQPGCEIKIPLNLTNKINLPNGSSISKKEDLYGCDIRISRDFDFEIKNGDLNLINGKDNLNQFITNTLFTNKGDIELNPTFGLGLPIGSPALLDSNNPNAKLIAVEVINELSKDPRIAKVSNVEIVSEKDIADIKLNVITFINQSINLSVPLI